MLLQYVIIFSVKKKKKGKDKIDSASNAPSVDTHQTGRSQLADGSLEELNEQAGSNSVKPRTVGIE